MTDRWVSAETSVLLVSESDPLAVSEVLTALRSAGWGLVYPDDWPGLCQRCKNPVAEGTRHNMFNGNQMFACSIESI